MNTLIRHFAVKNKIFARSVVSTPGDGTTTPTPKTTPPMQRYERATPLESEKKRERLGKFSSERSRISPGRKGGPFQWKMEEPGGGY